MQFKSTAELVKEINFNQEIVIRRIFADPMIIRQQRLRYESIVKDERNKIAPEVIDAEIQFSMFKDNIFSAIMNTIVTSFVFKIDEDEKNMITKRLEAEFAQESDGKISEEGRGRAAMIAEQMIKKHLIFNYLQELWGISVSDDEVKKMLEIFYQKTNQSIREILQNEERFENVRQTILEEKLVLRIVNSFPIRFNLAPPSVFQHEQDENAKTGDKKADDKKSEKLS